jgi:large subunit ribosomal protein L13Ae
MVPHKTARGSVSQNLYFYLFWQLALSNIKIFEGVPDEYVSRSKKVVPRAQRYLRLKPHRKVVSLGDLAASVGWKQQGVLKRIEAKRVADYQEKEQEWKNKAQMWSTAKKSVISQNILKREIALLKSIGN